MQKRKLGDQGLEVSVLGLGCMGMSYGYGPADESESINVLHRALDLGINFWDTAEMYGPFKNEELIGRAIKGKAREKIVIATKFAFEFGHNNETLGLNSSPAHIKKAIEGSLKRLNTDYIDLYYQHRLDPKTPIEDTVGALAELVKAGKVRYIGLSEVGPAIIRRAHAVHPLTAIQSEYSLWERDIEEKILPTVRELGIGFVAYSPMGRGFLTGKIKSIHELEQSDWRRTNPRFQEENFKHNFKLVEIVEEIAKKNKATPAQIALAWLLKQGNDIVPIPGTKHLKYLEENTKATSLNLPESAWDTLTDALKNIQIIGGRYSSEGMKSIDRTE